MTRGDQGIVGTVLQGLPITPALAKDTGCTHRERVEGLLPAAQPGARGEHATPELRLTFIDPEQTAAHGLVERSRPEVGGLTVTAVPRVYVFVSEQVAVDKVVRVV